MTGGSGNGLSGSVDNTGLTGVSIEGGFGDRFFADGTGGSCTSASLAGIPAGANGNSYCLNGLFGASTFERFDTDPDLLYVAGVEGSAVSAVPLPAGLPLLVAAFGVMGVVARRRRAV